MTIRLGAPQTLAYLATPYTKYPGGIVSAFIASCELSANLIKTGLKIYSPIAHCHAIAVHSDLDPLDHAMWMAQDEAMLSAADVLIVAHLPSWESSKGIQMEIDYFERARKPIFDLDPETLVMTRRKAVSLSTRNGCGND